MKFMRHCLILKYEEPKQLKTDIEKMVARLAKNGDDWTEAPES